jgi:hypothetical protein
MLVASAATIMRLSFELALKYRRQRYFQTSQTSNKQDALTRFTPLGDRFPDQSAERYADATVLAPHDVAGIDFLLRHNDQCELVGNIALRSDVERGSFVGQITNNAADRHLAEPDQSQVHNTAATRFSRFRQVDHCHSRLTFVPIGSVRAGDKMLVNSALIGRICLKS